MIQGSFSSPGFIGLFIIIIIRVLDPLSFSLPLLEEEEEEDLLLVLFIF
jgi:hypothetical protein